MVKLRTTKEYLAKLEKELHDNKCITPHLTYINAHLHNVLLAYTAAKHEPLYTFNKQFVVPPEKKSEHLWRFTKTIHSNLVARDMETFSCKAV